MTLICWSRTKVLPACCENLRLQRLPNHLEYFGGEGEDVEINPLIKWHIEKGKTLDL